MLSAIEHIGGIQKEKLNYYNFMYKYSQIKKF